MSFREGTKNLGNAIRMKALKVRECRISRGVGRECVFICRGKGNPVSTLRVQLWANLKIKSACYTTYCRVFALPSLYNTPFSHHWRWQEGGTGI